MATVNNPSIPPSEIHYHRWGWSRHLFVGERVSVSEAFGLKGGASSLHKHIHKANSFLVLVGHVCLTDQDGNVIKDVMPAESFAVTPGTLHRMEFREDSALHEVYQAVGPWSIDLDDIVREDLGWEPGGGPSRRLGQSLP